MIGRPGRYVPLLALVAVALISAWLLDGLEAARQGSVTGSRHVPDFYMEEFVASTMDEKGRLARRVVADYMAHFPDTDTNELAKPYLILYRDQAEPWHVRSERGWLSAGGDVMLLLGRVHVWREDESGRHALDIHTSDLRVLTETNYGETDQPAVITTPTTESHGIGMRAWLDEGRMELLSRVRTVVEPRGTEG